MSSPGGAPGGGGVSRAGMMLLLLACAAGSSSQAVCEDGAALDAGVVTATLDGADWESTATWVMGGESLQVNAAAFDGWSLTLVAQTTVDGVAITDALDAGSYPVNVDLGPDGGGWVLAYPSDGDSLSSDSGGGTLSFSAFDGDTLQACFSFDVANGSTALSASDGAVNATGF